MRNFLASSIILTILYSDSLVLLHTIIHLGSMNIKGHGLNRRIKGENSLYSSDLCADYIVNLFMVYIGNFLWKTSIRKLHG